MVGVTPPTDVAAGATVLSISTGHILATLARAVGEFRQVSAVVALINKETTVIETGQTVPVTAPDQVVLAGRLEDGAVASIAVQGGSAPVTPGFELRIVGTAATQPNCPSSNVAIRSCAARLNLWVPENLIRGCDQQSCPPCHPAVMITGYVPAVRLPPDHADDLMAAAVPA